VWHTHVATKEDRLEDTTDRSKGDIGWTATVNWWCPGLVGVAHPVSATWLPTTTLMAAKPGSREPRVSKPPNILLTLNSIKEKR
jgi:hypothetical protein